MLKRGLPQTVRMRHDLHYVDDIFHEDSETIGKYLPIDSVEPNPNQPRQVIGDISELAASIAEKGVLEPLLVRPFGQLYQIIAGERRWRACKQLGLDRVPCIIKEVDDKELLELALIENMQRKDLTAFEEAEGLQSLVQKFHYTHSEVARVIGKSRTSVTEVLSLNQMPEQVKELCRDADISSKSLLLQVVRQPDEESMRGLVERIRTANLTRQNVRDESPRKKSEPFTFHFNGQNFSLKIKFNKANVNSEEVKESLQQALASLE